MPSDGRRKKLIQGVATALRTIDGSADFFFNLTNSVYVRRDELEVRLSETYPIACRVYDLQERSTYRGATEGVTCEVTIVAEFTIRDSAQAIVDRVQDVIADVELALGRNLAPGGNSTMLRIDSIEPPFYDLKKEFAVVTVRLLGTYDYDLGIDR